MENPLAPVWSVDAGTLNDPVRALGLEWTVSDGTGAYASSTVIGCNTRRYHGLLVAPMRPPAERAVLLAGVGEQVIVGRRDSLLNVTEYPDVLHPEGYRHLIAFTQADSPQWTYSLGTVIVRKTVAMLRGRRAVAVRYSVAAGDAPVFLRLTPQAACRGFHELLAPDTPFDVSQTADGVCVRRAGLPDAQALKVWLRVAGADFEAQALRYSRVTFRCEAERGFPCEEQWFAPGAWTASLHAGQSVTLIASAEPLGEVDVDAEMQSERERRNGLPAAAGARTPLEAALVTAGDVFLVRGREAAHAAVLAGYPWFDAWGRDAFIALEGLALIPRRFDMAKGVLLAFAERIRDGLVPNYLGADPGGDAFNSMDASLWFVHAVARYLDYANDADAVRDALWPRVAEILIAYHDGTRHGIRADGDGLLMGGDAATQLTWMDAMAGGRPVTPRHGKTVEVNALWYNALRAAAALAERFGAAKERELFGARAAAAAAAFAREFWYEAGGFLYDVVSADGSDGRLRPNQLLAVSLPYAVLEERRWAAVVAAAQEHLYTPYGLRTLAPRQPGYRGRYAGPPEARDGAYHQGTAWAWLLGPFYEAYLKAHRRSPAARRFVAAALEAWPAHLADAGLGGVSEIFDGDWPHEPRGCVTQAWSVAELLRVAWLIRGD